MDGGTDVAVARDASALNNNLAVDGQARGGTSMRSPQRPLASKCAILMDLATKGLSTTDFPTLALSDMACALIASILFFRFPPTRGPVAIFWFSIRRLACAGRFRRPPDTGKP